MLDLAPCLATFHPDEGLVRFRWVGKEEGPAGLPDEVPLTLYVMRKLAQVAIDLTQRLSSPNALSGTVQRRLYKAQSVYDQMSLLAEKVPAALDHALRAAEALAEANALAVEERAMRQSTMATSNTDYVVDVLYVLLTQGGHAPIPGFSLDDMWHNPFWQRQPDVYSVVNAVTLWAIEEVMSSAKKNLALVSGVTTLNEMAPSRSGSPTGMPVEETLETLH